MARGQRSGGGVSISCALAGFLLLTACGVSAPDAADATDDEGGTIGLTSAELDLLTRSGSYVQGERALRRAESELITVCMADKGFPYRAGTSASAPMSFEDQLLGMDERRSRGYGLYAQFVDSPGSGEQREGGEPLPPGMENDAYVARLPEAEAEKYVHALRGNASDRREMRLPDDQKITFSGKGCEAVSREKLYGSLDDWAASEHVPQILNNSLTDRVTADPAYAAVMRKWKECMAAKGYSYKDPEDAYRKLRDEYGERGATQDMRKREIEVATDDGTCARQTHVPNTVLSLRRQYAKSLPATDKRDLRQLADIWKAAATQARKLTE
ncbi:hypothetical protein [Streptomyces sp. SP18BB07]|uniref:hypothetical protein n=1 Tax=Streptomyces sp. SP18BB07 TaxID=3002522 RepID=UPI002E77B8DE|nr:hypothetical protein [Streptomyces sp. SP18BB07]MEE1763865.1 hypothetical protein [Streptomyces sp. SP18BB07]